MRRPLAATISLLAVCALLVIPGTAPAATMPPTVTSFTAGLTAGSLSWGITAGPNGTVWYTDRNGQAVRRFTPSTGAVTAADFSFSNFRTSARHPAFIAALPNGAVWFTEPSEGRVGTIVPDQRTSKPFGYEYAAGINGSPTDIAAGPDGNVYFTEPDANAIARINPTTHTVTQFPLGADHDPTAITAGPDGDVWFTEVLANRIGRLDPSTGAITYVPGLGSTIENIQGITSGPDGNVWAVLSGAKKVARVEVNDANLRVTKFSLDPSYTPTEVTAGPDGNLWITATGQSDTDALEALDPATGSVRQVVTTSEFQSPLDVVAGSDGKVWFTDLGSKLGRVNLERGSLRIEINDVIPFESSGGIPIDVRRWGGSSGPASVHYATSDGSAVAGSDYQSTSGDLTWADGEEGAHTVIVIPIDDAVAEPTETFTFTLSDAVGVTLGGVHTAKVEIWDNDDTLQFDHSNYNVSESAGSATISITRQGFGSMSAGVHYETSDGSAVQGSDYTAVDGMARWSWTYPGPADMSPKTFSVPIQNDNTPEPSETLIVTLVDPAGGRLGTPSTATITIIDDDSDATYQPDLRIKVGRAAYVGNDVYSSSGSGERVRKSVSRGGRASFRFVVQNDGTAPDAITIIASRASEGFRLRYTMGGVDFTTDDGGLRLYITPAVEPGADAQPIKLVVTALPNAVVGSKKVVKIKAISDHGPLDVAKAIVRVR